jgi:hypothetical protein
VIDEKIARMMRKAALGVVLLLSGCLESGRDTYTLYRASSADPSMRIHVATFDAAEGSDYNRQNCDIAAGLFAKQPGVIVRYWCEKGGFRP